MGLIGYIAVKGEIEKEIIQRATRVAEVAEGKIERELKDYISFVNTLSHTREIENLISGTHPRKIKNLESSISEKSNVEALCLYNSKKEIVWQYRKSLGSFERIPASAWKYIACPETLLTRDQSYYDKSRKLLMLNSEIKGKNSGYVHARVSVTSLDKLKHELTDIIKKDFGEEFNVSILIGDSITPCEKYDGPGICRRIVSEKILPPSMHEKIENSYILNLKPKNYIKAVTNNVPMWILYVSVLFVFGLLATGVGLTLWYMSKLKTYLKTGKDVKPVFKIERWLEKHLMRPIKEYEATVLRAERVNLARRFRHDVKEQLNKLKNHAIEGNSAHILPVINDIIMTLDKFRGSDSSGKIDKSELDIKNILAETLSDLKPYMGKVGKDNIKTHLHLKEDDFWVYAKRNSIINATNNLLYNAVDAVDNHGTIEVSCSKLDGKLHIRIKDSGKGIPRNIQHKIFDDEFSHAKSHGQGHGLYNAKQDIEASGGMLALLESSTLGSIFEVTLPLIQRSSNFIDFPQIKPNQLIVVIDDDTSYLTLWQKYAQRSGHEIKTFESSLRAHEELSNTWSTIYKNALFIIDQYFIGESSQGIDLAKKLLLEFNAEDICIVTDAYEDPDIQYEINQLQILLAPKSKVQEHLNQIIKAAA